MSEQNFVILFEENEMGSYHQDWPAPIRVAVLVDDLEKELIIYHAEEEGALLEKLRKRFEQSGGIAITPPREGFERASISFAQEQALVQLISDRESIKEDAENYLVNFRYMLEENLLGADGEDDVQFPPLQDDVADGADACIDQLPPAGATEVPAAVAEIPAAQIAGMNALYAMAKHSRRSAEEVGTVSRLKIHTSFKGIEFTPENALPNSSQTEITPVIRATDDHSALMILCSDDGDYERIMSNGFFFKPDGAFDPVVDVVNKVFDDCGDSLIAIAFPTGILALLPEDQPAESAVLAHQSEDDEDKTGLSAFLAGQSKNILMILGFGVLLNAALSLANVILTAAFYNSIQDIPVQQPAQAQEGAVVMDESYIQRMRERILIQDHQDTLQNKE